MGIDAPSTDLTERIRQIRSAGVASGEIEPARPGEHSLVGRSGAVDLERLAAAHTARDRREARRPVPGGDEVVEFEYTEEEREALGLSVEDGGEPQPTQEDPEVVQAIGAADEPPLPDEAEEPVPDFDLGPERPVDVDAMQADAVQAEILARVEELHRRMDGQDTALLLIAKAISGGTEDHEALAEMLVVIASSLSPRPSWWRRLVSWLRTPR